MAFLNDTLDWNAMVDSTTHIIVVAARSSQHQNQSKCKFYTFLLLISHMHPFLTVLSETSDTASTHADMRPPICVRTYVNSPIYILADQRQAGDRRAGESGGATHRKPSVAHARTAAAHTHQKPCPPDSAAAFGFTPGPAAAPVLLAVQLDQPYTYDDPPTPSPPLLDPLEPAASPPSPSPAPAPAPSPSPAPPPPPPLPTAGQTMPWNRAATQSSVSSSAHSRFVDVLPALMVVVIHSCRGAPSSVGEMDKYI
jgi:hypothetical protein